MTEPCPRRSNVKQADGEAVSFDGDADEATEDGKGYVYAPTFNSDYEPDGAEEFEVEYDVDFELDCDEESESGYKEEDDDDEDEDCDLDPDPHD